MRRACTISSVAILAVTVAFSARAGDWPQFRGPGGDGVCGEANLPVEWGPSKNVAWKQSVPGKGWSSPVVQGGRIYLTTATVAKDSPNKAPSLRALCLNAETGKSIWDVEVFAPGETPAPPIQSKNSHASPTPIVCDDRLYVHFGHQGTACLSLDGKVVWRNKSLTYQPVHGNGGSPICVDDLLVYSADGGDTRFVIALDRGNGSVRWKTARSWPTSRKFSFTTPLLITVAGKQQIVSPGSDGVAAYAPADGKEIWKVRYLGYSVIPKPLFGNGLVYICTGYEIPSLIAIRPDGQGDVSATHVAWKVRKGVPSTPSLLLVGDELYQVADGGIASCLNAKTGAVHWQNRLSGHYSASPLYAAGRIYFQSEEGVGTVIKAGTKFEQVAKNDLRERSLASFAAADGALYIRTEHDLYRIQSR